MLKKFCWMCCALIISAPFLRAGDSPQKIIQEFENKLNTAKTMRVIFEETYLWKLTGEENSLKGELILEGESRFRVTTEDQVIVSNGKTLWTYSPSSNQVLIDTLAVSDETLLPRQIFFRYTKDYRLRLVGEESYAGTSCYVLELTSESGDEFIPRVKVWISKADWLPRKIEQMDLNENKTIYVLPKIETGITVEPGIFEFTIPQGAEVIQMN